MNQVLIYKDEARIESELDHLGKVADYFQAIYNACKELGIEVNLAEMATLGTQANKWGNKPDVVLNFVAEKLLDKAGSPEFNGVPIQRNKLKELIAVPDLSLLQEIVKEYELWKTVLDFRINLLNLVNDVVTISPEAESKLNEEFTFQTKTEESAQMATQLNNLCDALNAWQDANLGHKAWQIAHDEEFIPGIRSLSRKFVVDLKYIRDRERLIQN